MVYVMLNHLPDQLLANVGVVMPVPAAEFIEHIYAEFVAGIEEMAVRRVVAGADRVAVQIFYDVDVVSGYLRGQGPAGIGPERMAVDAPEEDALAVDEHALAGAEFNGAESELLMHGMHHSIAQFQSNLELVENRRFGIPESRIVDLSREM